jgi:hypothetical protein
MIEYPISQLGASWGQTWKSVYPAACVVINDLRFQPQAA